MPSRTLLAEAQSGFPNLQGTRLTGAIPIPQAVLDELLTPVASGQLTIRCENDNRVAPRYSGIPLPPAKIVGVDEALTVTLRFPTWARPALWIASRRNPRYVRFASDYVHIDVGAIPGVAAYRYIWKYLSLSLSSQAGMLVIRFRVDIP